MNTGWRFWIDRGGTFTDFVAQCPSGSIHTLKLLSKSEAYKDAVVEGVLRLTQGHQPIEEIRMGTTVATNAFLENTGARTALITTLGFFDLLQIRGQKRPRLFDLHVTKQTPVYDLVTVILERMGADGQVVIPLDEDIARFELERLRALGVTSLAVALMHSTLNPCHELAVEKMANDLGFDYISLSHRVSPVPKLISRAETSTLDARLSPVLLDHTRKLSDETGFADILFMQSHGGLSRGENLRGHNALLSGPAGGYVGAVKVCKNQGFDRIITFDMGGTSTDVALFAGKDEVDYEPVFHGLQLQTPMLDIHTVAAGGGSILVAEKGRLRVGPESAGALPGPACYRNGGPLTVTDANLFLGRIKSTEFPKVFGPNGDQSLDETVVRDKFEVLARELGTDAKTLAENFLDVAVETMAGAIRTVSVARGYDPKDFVMCCFGGAGAQLACKVADRLGIQKIFVHQLSSLLSAYGMGLTEEKYRNTVAINKNISDLDSDQLQKQFTELEKQLSGNFTGHGKLVAKRLFQLRPSRSDYFLETVASNVDEAVGIYRRDFKRTFGFEADEDITVQAISLELAEARPAPPPGLSDSPQQRVTGFFRDSQNHTCVVIDAGWSGVKNSEGHWTLQSIESADAKKLFLNSEAALEICYQRLQTIAEEMGEVLKKTGYSVNIKERLDYSCAIFTTDCELIANAPHMPVHLGSMSECVAFVDSKFRTSMKPGDAFISNSPLEGGTHLPDITVVTPVYFDQTLAFYVASRGHHADIGGITPGSMPSSSTRLQDEGVVIEVQRVAQGGVFLKDNLKKQLLSGPHPSRNVEQNLHDIKAQLAANQKGQQALEEFMTDAGMATVQSNANRLLFYTAEKLKQALINFKSGSANIVVEDGRQIAVTLKNDERLTVDFHGTSSRDGKNFHAPKPVTKAAVLYCLRCLLTEDIPLNDGLARNLDLVIPDNSLLDPGPENAVVAGNVETSQLICDAIFEALGALAHSQGTMNNVSFGTNAIQYYETLGGGMGAGDEFHGASGLQVHMTNSQLTDPEVLESRFPVRLHNFSMRRGSGGDGNFHGGDGLDRRLEFLSPMDFQLLSQRRLHAPKGLFGGSSARVGDGFVEFVGPGIRKIGACESIEMPAGAQVYLSTPGGGGYGSPVQSSGHRVFAYGSNLDEMQFLGRCPSAKIIGRARLKDYSIHYSRFSPERNCGVMDVYRKPGSTVWGLVYCIDDNDLRELDRIEGHPNAYTRLLTDVHFDDETSDQVWIYDVPDKRPHIEPSKLYRWLVYQGAFRINAPKSYLDLIGLELSELP